MNNLRDLMSESIIPEGLIGEQYSNDVALIFKIKERLIDNLKKGLTHY